MRMGVVEAVQEQQFGAIAVVLVVEDIKDVALEALDEYEGQEAERGGKSHE